MTITRKLQQAAGAIINNPVSPDWTLIKTWDLTSDGGWTQTNGNRGLDSSYCRAQQTTFSSAGMKITAERASVGATIYSSDAQGRFYALPDHFAFEIDWTLGGWVGSGCFPAIWFRPMSGQGELDLVEYFGGVPSGETYREKTTVIKTSASPYNIGLVSKPIPVASVAGQDFSGFHTWRYEKVPNQVTLRCDGNLIASITQAQIDTQGTGTWAEQFEAGEQWYPRLTYQFGPPTNGGTNYAGDVPDTWVDPVNSWMLVSRMQAWSWNG